MSLFLIYSSDAHLFCFFFFCKQKTAYELRIRDGSSDVCSSDREDALDRRIGQNDLESGRYLFLGGAAANVQEVCGESAVQLDDVHCGHGKASAVHHATDVAVQLDISEIIFARFQFHRVFFGLVTQFHQVRMTEHGVAVETDLCIQHDQLAIVSNGKRIDLDLRRISADEGVIERLCYLRCLLGEIAGQVQRLCDRTAVVRHQACSRVEIGSTSGRERVCSSV